MTEIILELLEDGYTGCVAGDISKQVEDDGTSIGPLVAYDNDNRLWWIRTDTIIAAGSVMTIASTGTGAGTSMTSDQYCTEDQIKIRVMVNDLDTNYDADLTSCAQEASRMVDEKLRRYMTTDEDAIEQISPYMIFKELPLNSVPAVIADITADIGAGLFNRRIFPLKMDVGFLGQGFKKLDDFINSNFKQGRFNIVTREEEIYDG
jgi:hypothetical protein